MVDVNDRFNELKPAVDNVLANLAKNKDTLFENNEVAEQAAVKLNEQLENIVKNETFALKLKVDCYVDRELDKILKQA